MTNEPTKVRIPRPSRVLCATPTCLNRVWLSKDMTGPVYCTTCQQANVWRKEGMGWLTQSQPPKQG